FDNDDEKTFKQTTDFIHETALDLPLFNILTPIPGTRFYDRMMKEERVVPSSWEEFNGYKVCFKPENLTPETLMNGFYSSIEDVYSYEAIFNRVEKLYNDGALKLDENFYLARTIITVLLLKELFVQKKNMRRFIRRTIKELWVKKGIRINMLLLFLDRYEFTQKLKYIRAAEANC
ncbi:MAG: DUF4070 domain-containing protein, partial [bacterium]|nr:DUF4070 domain-containing protein [bacterium]